MEKSQSLSGSEAEKMTLSLELEGHNKPETPVRQRTARDQFLLYLVHMRGASLRDCPKRLTRTCVNRPTQYGTSQIGRTWIAQVPVRGTRIKDLETSIHHPKHSCLIILGRVTHFSHLPVP